MLDWTFLRMAQLDATNLPKTAADQDRLNTIFNTTFAIMAAVAVLIVVVAGFRFITSRGDPQATGKARNTIIDAAIGLVIITVAYAIVGLAIGVIGG